MPSIVLDNLTKRFPNSQIALDNVSFEVPKGAIFGFLGPNGAGKTTTVRLLNCILSPTSGQAVVEGHNIASNPLDIHKISGVMTETANLYEELTGQENILFFGRLHDMDNKILRARSESLLAHFELSDQGGKKVRHYSTGMKKKLSLAVAMLHSPKVLFLDEPTSGLDPEAARHVTDHIKKLSASEGCTIFLCTHQLKVFEDVCTLFGFLDQGKLKATGTFKELLGMVDDSLHLRIRGSNFKDMPGMTKEPHGDAVIRLPNEESIPDIIEQIVKSGGRIKEARIEHKSLEDLYFNLIKKEPVKTAPGSSHD